MNEEQGITVEVGITAKAKYDPKTGVISIIINGKEVERKVIKLKNVEPEPLVVEWDSPIKYTPLNGWDWPVHYTSAATSVNPLWMAS